MTDYLFACGTRRAAKALHAAGITVHAYEFNDPDAPMGLQPAVSFPFKAYHASEIQYLFDLPSTELLTPAQRTLADQMVTLWANFAKSPVGDPNSAGSSLWPAYDLTEPVLRFAPSGPVVFNDFSAAHHCTGLWTPGI